MGATLQLCGDRVKRAVMHFEPVIVARSFRMSVAHVLRAAVIAATAVIVVIAGVGLTPATMIGQGADAAFLFAYRAKPDMDAAFAQGYRRHLDWHAAHGDSLTWLAWTVIDGPSIGTFVDGAFGLAFKAFDDRVDPAGDGQDAGRNVTAFATPTGRQLLRVRRDLSLTTPLESGAPLTMQRVATLTLKPGTEAAAERTLRMLASRKFGLDYAVYERLSGGDQPTYVIIAQFDAWRDLADAHADPVRAIVRALGASVSGVESSIWQYRPDLTYIPKR